VWDTDGVRDVCPQTANDKMTLCDISRQNASTVTIAMCFNSDIVDEWRSIYTRTVELNFPKIGISVSPPHFMHPWMHLVALVFGLVAALLTAILVWGGYYLDESWHGLAVWLFAFGLAAIFHPGRMVIFDPVG
jgi:hypothetical protein